MVSFLIYQDILSDLSSLYPFPLAPWSLSCKAHSKARANRLPMAGPAWPFPGLELLKSGNPWITGSILPFLTFTLLRSVAIKTFNHQASLIIYDIRPSTVKMWGWSVKHTKHCKCFILKFFSAGAQPQHNLIFNNCVGGWNFLVWLLPFSLSRIFK